MPVNGEPTDEGAGQRDERELQLCDEAQIAAPGLNAGNHCQSAHDYGNHRNEILQREPFVPGRRGGHEVVPFDHEVAEQCSEQNNP